MVVLCDGVVTEKSYSTLYIISLFWRQCNTFARKIFEYCQSPPEQGENDNFGKGVTLNAIDSKTGNPTGLDYELQINGKKDACNGKAGGYITSTPCSPDTTYYYVICAKIDEGVAIEMAHNKMGAANWSAKESEWLTSNIGTGEYEWYVGKLVSYPAGIPDGTFQDVGHVFTDVNRDITWSVAYHAIVECPN